MKIENTIQLFKEIHPEKIILIKVGTFLHAYGKDAYILSYIFNYQMKKVQANYSTCGFPISGKAKVLSKLEEMQISYIIISKAENYEVIEQEDFKSKNTYTEIFSKAHKYMTKKNRIENIYQFLLENIFEEDTKEKLTKIEEILYETRKV